MAMVSWNVYVDYCRTRVVLCIKHFFLCRGVTLALDAGFRESVLLGGRGGVRDLVLVLIVFLSRSDL